MNPVEKSALTTIDWKINSEEDSLDVIVKDTGAVLAYVQNGTSNAVYCRQYQHLCSAW